MPYVLARCSTGFAPFRNGFRASSSDRARREIDIKAKRTIAGADTTGLRSFAEQHPRVPLAVACLAPEPQRLGEVRVLPYRQLLAEVAELAA